eukprot:COSAG01_NODE_65172_length_274_cov_0.588571_1_plen_73_part_10
MLNNAQANKYKVSVPTSYGTTIILVVSARILKRAIQGQPRRTLEEEALRLAVSLSCPCLFRALYRIASGAVSS